MFFVFAIAIVCEEWTKTIYDKSYEGWGPHRRGDAPGLNPAIKGLVYRGSELGLTIVGLFDGWRSLLNPLPETLPLKRETVRRWDRDGGTNLGSSRTNPFKQLTETGELHDRSAEVLANIEKLKLDAIVACGARTLSA